MRRTGILVALVAGTFVDTSVRGEPPPQPAALAGSDFMLPELGAVVNWLDKQHERIRRTADYTGLRVSRETTDGEHQAWKMKVRQQPFAIFLEEVRARPSQVRHLLYVAGQREGRMLAGLDGNYRGFREFQPTDALAIHDSGRHPFNKYDVAHVLQDYRELLAEEFRSGAWVLAQQRPAKFDNKTCLVLQLDRAKRDDDRKLRRVEIWWDIATRWPVRFARFDSTDRGPAMELVEECAFFRLDLDPGLADIDFDEHNPDYFFHPPPPGHRRRAILPDASSEDGM